MVEVSKKIIKKTLSQLELLIQMFEKSLDDSRIKTNPLAKRATKEMINSIKKNKEELEFCQ